MYSNSKINDAITKTLDRMRAKLNIIPEGLGIVNSPYRVSIYNNDNNYYVYNHSNRTGCDDSTESLMNDEVEYYKALICALTKLKSVNVKTCNLKPVKKSTQASWDKLDFTFGGFEFLFQPLWNLTYICDGIDLYYDADFDEYDIDNTSYNNLFDLYYDLILARNNSSKNEDKSNGYILKNIANIRAIGAILSFRFNGYDD